MGGVVWESVSKASTMKTTLRTLSSQISKASPDTTEMHHLLEAYQSEMDKIEQAGYYDANDKQSMIAFIKKDKFYQHTELSTHKLEELRPIASELASRKICRDEGIAEHHKIEWEGGLL